MKLNICCGKHVLEGYFNIDIQPTKDAPAPDLLADARAVPLPDGCADEVMAIHALEHFYRWECDAVMAEWFRLLKAGGRLVLELPDLLKCCQNLIDGDMKTGKGEGQLSYSGIYGDPNSNDPHMAHKWGWEPLSLRRYLISRGFVRVVETRPQFHPVGRAFRDMRLEARKPPL